ncbi:MAG: hypothetical protein IKO42_04170, partial [Opitutales bacterium]|nr:hypothetical protein [Opitutales bacterium]
EFKPKPTSLCVDCGMFTDKVFELAQLNDSAPLFLPTTLNYGVPVFELPRAGGEFANQTKESPMEAMKAFEVSFSLKGGYEIPMEFFVRNHAFSHFMRADSDDFFDSSSYADARMEILSLGDGKVVLRALADIDFDAGGELWSPVEITLVVAKDGSISPPLVASVSGIEALDEAFVKYLNSNARKLHLPEGAYLITFSP